MDNSHYRERESDERQISIVGWQRKAFRRCVTLMAGAVLAFPVVALAQAAEPTLSVFSHREQWIAAFEQLPEARLRAFFLHCDRESREHLVQFDDAVRCAMAWDALLKRGFANDVNALLAWWREQRDLITTQSTQQLSAERR